jgi:uncharacterized membrane protein YhaH (DUF805 family)
MTRYPLLRTPPVPLLIVAAVLILVLGWPAVVVPEIAFRLHDRAEPWNPIPWERLGCLACVPWWLLLMWGATC